MAEWEQAEGNGDWTASCEVCGWQATFDAEGPARVAAEAHHHDDDLEH